MFKLSNDLSSLSFTSFYTNRMLPVGWIALFNIILLSTLLVSAINVLEISHGQIFINEGQLERYSNGYFQGYFAYSNHRILCISNIHNYRTDNCTSRASLATSLIVSLLSNMPTYQPTSLTFTFLSNKRLQQAAFSGTSFSLETGPTSN